MIIFPLKEITIYIYYTVGAVAAANTNMLTPQE